MENKQGEAKKIMTKALKTFVTTEIKKLGFSGTFPHFRRKRNERFELFSFQFNLHGGSFILECGFITPKELATSGTNVHFNKLTYGDTYPNKRVRIIPGDSSGEDFWFTYSGFKNEIQFENLAKSIISLLPKIETFFENNL